jgi:hypothetical protein
MKFIKNFQKRKKANSHYKFALCTMNNETCPNKEGACKIKPNYYLKNKCFQESTPSCIFVFPHKLMAFLNDKILSMYNCCA